MMIPKKEFNIYPKSKENVEALLHFYFDKFNLDREYAVEKIMENTSLSLNQVEFIVRKLSEAYPQLFSSFFAGGQTSIANLMRYGIDGLTKDEKNWDFGPTSSARPKIKEFIDFVKKTEVDYDYLQKNN